MHSTRSLRGLFLPTLDDLGDPLTNLLALNKWFVRLRWMAGALYGLAVYVMWYAFRAPIAGPELLAVAAAIVAYNGVFAVIVAAMPKRGRVTIRRLLIVGRTQVVADLVALTLLIHFTGGAESPLVFFYLFHIVIASVILRRESGYVYASLAVLLYAVQITIDYFQPQLHYHIEGFLPSALNRNVSFAVGSAAVFAFTAYIVAYLATTIVERMRQREGQLAKAYRELFALESRKSRFMRSAAHHLRSPLSSIYMCLRTVEGGYAAGEVEKQKELIGRARTRSLEMLELVSDLITLSRLKDVDLSRVEEEAVEFDAALKKVVEEQKEIAKAGQVKLTATYGADGLKVHANREQIDDIITNLLSNAVKYTPSGGKVRIASRRDDGRVVFEVSDSGIGIPPDEMEHLFEEFFRASNAKKMSSEGTGLGLCIARELLKRMGGEIRVESRLNEGSTFTVFLPEWRGAAKPV